MHGQQWGWGMGSLTIEVTSDLEAWAGRPGTSASQLCTRAPVPGARCGQGQVRRALGRA